MDPNAVRTEKQTKSAIYLVLAVILVVAAVGGVAFAFIQYPDLLKNVLLVILIIIGALVLIGIAIWIFALFLAVPLYARGTTVQTDMKYDVDDVQEVDGAMLNKEEKKE